VSLRIRHMSVAEEHGYIVNLNASQEGFDGESVAEHVRATTLGRAIWLFKIGDTEQFSQAPGIPVYRTSGIAMTTPEKVQGILGRKLTQELRDFWWQRYIHGIAGFRAPKKYGIVLIEASAFESNGVNNGQTAPTHQQDQGQEPLGSDLTIGSAVTVVRDGGQNLIKLLTREVVSGSGFGNLGPFELQQWVAQQPTVVHTEQKKALEAFVFAPCSGGSQKPLVAKLQERAATKVFQVLQPVLTTPG